MVDIVYTRGLAGLIFALNFEPQRGPAPAEEPDDGGQPGRGLWSHTPESSAGDGGRHHGH